LGCYLAAHFGANACAPAGIDEKPRALGIFVAVDLSQTPVLRRRLHHSRALAYRRINVSFAETLKREKAAVAA